MADHVASTDLVNVRAPVTFHGPRSAATAYHIGLPNFKTMLCLRYLLAVWSIFIGSFYEEVLGWATGIMLLAVGMTQTAARIRPSLWERFRGSLVVTDGLCLLLALVGLFQRTTLIRGLYIFSTIFLLAQLVIALVVWPRPALHSFCFPTYHREGSNDNNLPPGISGEMCEEGREQVKGPRWRLRKIPYVIIWTAVTALFALMVATTGQRLMIYPGTLFKVRIPEEFPADLGLDVELVSFFTPDQKRLSALFVKPNKIQEAKIQAEHPNLPRMTLWIFYGNTGNMVHQMDCVVPLMQAAYPNLQYFIFSYRGYVNSDGRPHISGLRRDIDGALAYLKRRSDVDSSRIVGYGHSIGGALVCDIIGRHPGILSATILSNTFLSMHRMSETWHVPFLKPFITETWDSQAALRRASNSRSLPPILFMSSRKDELIPAYHMDGLADIAETAEGVEHTRLVLPLGYHNYWNDPEKVHQAWHSFLHRVALT